MPDPTRDGSPLIAVRMSDTAAACLAKACREARWAILDTIEVDGRKSTKREEDIVAMLDWASNWLIYPGARVDPTTPTGGES